MWDKSLDSDPLYFYYLQDGIRVGLLRTGYTASVGPTRCLRPGTGGHRKHHQEPAAPTWVRATSR